MISQLMASQLMASQLMASQLMASQLSSPASSERKRCGDATRAANLKLCNATQSQPASRQRGIESRDAKGKNLSRAIQVERLPAYERGANRAQSFRSHAEQTISIF